MLFKYDSFITNYCKNNGNFLFWSYIFSEECKKAYYRSINDSPLLISTFYDSENHSDITTYEFHNYDLNFYQEDKRWEYDFYAEGRCEYEDLKNLCFIKMINSIVRGKIKYI
jgi:hypothetical protein